MRPLALTILFGVALTVLSAPVRGAAPGDGARSDGAPMSMVPRTSCGDRSVESVYEDLDGAVADQLEELQARFESTEGFRGVIYDGNSSVVVVDEMRLPEWDREVAGSGLRVAMSCVPQAVIDAAMSAVTRVQFDSGEFSSVGYNVMADAVVVTSTLTLEEVAQAIDAGLPARSDSLSAAFSLASGTLRINTASNGSVSRSGRMNDVEPYQGGAAIFTNDMVCSTGFYINSNTNGTVMVTAGHCALNGTTAWNGQNSNFVGVFEGRRFPDPDLILIDDQDYQARSFAANDNTTSKAISSSGVPTTGISYCQMGWTKKRICTSYDSMNEQFCDDFGCTNSLAYAEQGCAYPSGSLANGGDSGAGVYKELTGGTLSARGIVVAAGYKNAGFTCMRWDHKVQTVTSTYAATVVTQ